MIWTEYGPDRWCVETVEYTLDVEPFCGMWKADVIAEGEGWIAHWSANLGTRRRAMAWCRLSLRKIRKENGA